MASAGILARRGLICQRYNAQINIRLSLTHSSSSVSFFPTTCKKYRKNIAQLIEENRDLLQKEKYALQTKFVKEGVNGIEL